MRRNHGSDGCQLGEKILQRLPLCFDFGSDVCLDDVEIVPVLQPFNQALGIEFEVGHGRVGIGMHPGT